MKTEMAAWGPDDYQAAQYQDELEQRRLVEDALEHIRDVIAIVERDFDMTLETTRAQLRIIENALTKR